MAFELCSNKIYARFSCELLEITRNIYGFSLWTNSLVKDCLRRRRNLQ